MSTAKIVIDIETLGLPPSEEEKAEKRAELAEEYKKEETIEKHLESWIKNKYHFSTEGAQLLCAGMALLDSKDEIASIESFASDDPGAVCNFINGFITECAPSRVQYIGYNLDRFDIPIITSWFARIGIELVVKIGLFDTIDLSEYPIKGGSLKRKCKTLRVDVRDDSTNGSMVAALWEQDKKEGTNKVREYCELDVERTAGLYKRLRKTHSFER